MFYTWNCCRGMAGPKLTAADIVAYPGLKLLLRASQRPEAAPLELGLDGFNTRFPGIAAWTHRVEQLPGYEKTSMSPMGGSIARFAALRQWDRVYGKDRTDMPRRRYKPEEIVAKLRQVDVLVSHGQNMADAIRQIGVSEVTFYRMPPSGEVMAVRTVIVARQAPDPANLYLLL
jgi:hypothetical protein